MSRSATAAAITAFFLLVLVGLLSGGDERDLTATSYGKIPGGHGAVYDVLRELGFPVARSFAAHAELAAGRTIWWIEPEKGCAAFDDPAFAAWVEAGATGVVLLPAAASACAPGASLAGAPLPARIGCACENESENDTEADVLEEPVPEPDPEPERVTIAGSLVRAPRTLEIRSPVAFVPEAEWALPVGTWEIVATQDGAPFALERRAGAGRVVVVADARFLENRNLDRADAAVLAVDLALARGTPWLDERAHGLVPSRDALAYLAGSPAAGPLAGLLLAALAFAWYGAAEPPRRVSELDPDAPTLETYVESLAGLYAATRDHARVLERYRELSARRLRRGLGLPPDTPLSALLDRLARRRSLAREGLAELRSTEPVRSAGDLARRAAVLDRLVEEASR